MISTIQKIVETGTQELCNRGGSPEEMTALADAYWELSNLVKEATPWLDPKMLGRVTVAAQGVVRELSRHGFAISQETVEYWLARRTDGRNDS